MTEPSSETLHASCVAIDGRAVLIEGRSGTGKSDLALRLIDRGAMLVGDDQVLVRRHRDGTLTAAPPDRIAGRIEVRGVGIVERPFVADVPVALLVTATDIAPRLPGSDRRRVAGITVPTASLALLEPSAPLKVELLIAAVPTA